MGQSAASPRAGERRNNCSILHRSMLMLLLLPLSQLLVCSGAGANYEAQAIADDASAFSSRKHGYMALDSYANEVTEHYCPPAKPTRSKFSVFGFLSMMVSLSLTVTNVINAINNNNNNNNDNNN